MTPTPTNALLAIGLLLAGCDSRQPAAGNSGPVQAGDSAAPGGTDGQPAALKWDLQASGEGTALALLSGSGATVMRLFCPARAETLLVNVPAFKPIGSEERLSFGGGGDAVALVADAKGDRARGGVSGSGAIPAGLGRMLSGPVSANYGAQASGPHPPPAPDVAARFVRACSERPTSGGRPPPSQAGACRTQDGREIAANRLRALGTEPFWGARIEGRCVTYSTPEEEGGTRVWARFSGSRDSGVWSGSLNGKPFVLKTRPAPGCSDGMSDNRYPVAVTLSVGGEQRIGCAKPD